MHMVTLRIMCSSDNKWLEQSPPIRMECLNTCLCDLTACIYASTTINFSATGFIDVTIGSESVEKLTGYYLNKQDRRED